MQALRRTVRAATLKRCYAHTMHAALRRTSAPIVRRMATEELGFKDFIRRAQVKAQFREMLRLARRYARARPAAGADVLRQVRDGYRRHRSERDGFAVAQLISDGRTKLRELRALAAGADEDAGPVEEYEVGTDWPWTADQSPRVPPKPLGLPRR